MCLLVCMLWFGAQAVSAELTVAVASNFLAPMTQLKTTFEENSPHKVRLVSGSSGRLYAQIRQGAPFDVFFSADQDKPNRLVEQHRVLPGYSRVYAQGVPVLWSPQAQSAEEVKARLLQGQYNKLALANPALAPYGLAAQSVMDRLKVRSSAQASFVLGESVAQAYQFVFSGNAQLGWVALSQIQDPLHSATGAIWVPPVDWYPPVLQGAVVLKRAEGNPAAYAFWQFLQAEAARAVIRQYGYTLGPVAPVTGEN